jgi:hypothetical protein
MTPAHITRILTYVETGQPTQYAGTCLMRDDIKEFVKSIHQLESQAFKAGYAQGRADTKEAYEKAYAKIGGAV